MKRSLLFTAIGLCVALGGRASILEWTQEEARVCEENADAMTFRCRIAAEDAFQTMRQKYYLPRDDEARAYLLMLEREKRKAAYDYISKTTWDRVANKERLDELYQASIDSLLLPHNDLVAGQNVRITLRLAESIGVSPENRSRVMRLGLGVARHLRKNPRYNYDVEVMDTLRNLLSKEQLYEVLGSKHAVESVKKGIAAWKELKSAGMVEEEDSASCCSQAIDYYMTEAIVTEMYTGHEKQLRKNLSDLWKRQPLLVRMKGAMERKEALVRKHEEEKENSHDEMVW